ncbi:MAG: preprotein translocase subunit SecE [Clostridiales bacterium]|jgi:preprotein translocase subunit SecE|nr:preprotein translocase subunit SecE [Clostridiales bacterium]HOL79485.1 preprotein translocase subunit SecE [Clostridiales bacterium]HPP67998.1 preprotein translocase subunit SecE [Clostridiales bacterium]HPU67997.1 preprotein translocase subunit SecE [Clostridiales bacterium]HXK83753.1 preprotein translocase subunit SecE [Clostridiales bacterium]
MADEKKKVDKTSEKEAAKAKKKAAEALIKEKRKELKKAPKEGKEGNVLQRAAKAIAKFFKDFRGTVKKIIWPDRKSVIKNTLVVFAVVIVVGIGVWVVDFALSESVKLVGRAAEAIQQDREETEEETTKAETTTKSQTEAETTTSAADETGTTEGTTA